MIKFIQENWISLIALSISLIALFRDLFKDFINNQKKKKENKKAVIKISYINKKIVISNYGKCSAKNLRIYLDDIDIFEIPEFSAFAKNIDFSLLTPDNSIGIKNIQHMQMKLNYKIKVIYDDNYKKNNIAEDIINMI